MWSLWDTSNNGKIDKAEFAAAKLLMDLNGDNRTSQLEAELYFTRNKYLLCRP